MAALTLGVGVAVSFGSAAHADTFEVTNTNNAGAGSLRAAVNDANANPGADVILFAPGINRDPILLNGVLVVTDDLVIRGNGRRNTIVSGNDTTQVLRTSGDGVKLTLRKLRIRDGRDTFEGAGIQVGSGSAVHCRNSAITGNLVTGNESSGAYGGGVAIGSDGVFTARGCTFSGNRVRGTEFGYGGAIANFGTLTIRNSTLNGNGTSGGGGGIYNFGGALLVNSTVSGNRALLDGGGIFSDEVAPLSLNNTTITRNTADRDDNGTGSGGGIFSGGGVTMGNTILAGNLDPSGRGDDCRGPITSRGHNLIRSTGGCTLSGRTGSNIVGEGAKLGDLQANGGPTRTHLPRAASPAVDAANPGPADGDGRHCAKRDQRGVRRPKDGDGNGTLRCDIGSVERK